MKILFIYPNAGSQLGFNYGLSHISAVLRKAGHAVEIWQMCEDIAPLPEEKDFVASVRRSAPDIIGFSVVTNQWEYSAKLAKWAREGSRAPIVCGGIHATVAPDEILRSGFFNYIFIGECEEAFAEFADKLAAGKPVEGVANLGYLKDGKVIVNPVRPLPELDKLPFKDYESFDFQKIIDGKRGWVGLMASRGCPFSCTYCFNHLMVKKYRSDLKCSFKELKYIRHFPIGQVIDEIVYLQKNYRNISMYIFDDDLFTFDKDYVVEFCKEYRKVSDLPFVVNAHFGFFDEERARALKDANCRIVKFGIESGSEKIRASVMNRHMSNQKIIESVNLVERHGMHSSVFIMVGIPFEEEKDLMDTIHLLGKAKPGRFRWTYFFPYPGTEAHDLAVKGNYIDYRKMKELVNFTDESCLDFGPGQNLLLSKIGRIMPWFVNACAGLETSPFYKEKVDKLLAMDEKEWKKASPGILDEDKKISKSFQIKNLSHYAVKYNPFMGVISDYFMNEK